MCRSIGNGSWAVENTLFLLFRWEVAGLPVEDYFNAGVLSVATLAIEISENILNRSILFGSSLNSLWDDFRIVGMCVL